MTYVPVPSMGMLKHGMRTAMAVGRAQEADARTVFDPLPAPPPSKVSIGIMRSKLQSGADDMKRLFQAGNPGYVWIFGLGRLHARFLSSSPSGLPEGVDARLWQPLVPLLIRSFQLARDIQLALPLGDCVALKGELCTTGLWVTLGLLLRFGGHAAGQVWRFRCGLEAMKLALDPEGAVQRDLSLRRDMEMPLLDAAVRCMKSSIGMLKPVYVQLLSVCRQYDDLHDTWPT